MRPVSYARHPVSVQLVKRALNPATHAQSGADFYKDTITIIVGFGPGGGYDLYSRVLARHIGRHIPGNSTVLAQNLPGAGSVRAANHVYMNAPEEGTGTVDGHREPFAQSTPSAESDPQRI